MPRLALVSAVAESSTEARLLRQHGFVLRVAASTHADLILPSPRGGSLAFVVVESAGAIAAATQRAAHAAKAARRCTILCVCARGEGSLDAGDGVASVPAHGLSCPVGVSALWCESHEQACEHMLACAQRVAAASEPGAASAAEEIERAQHVAAERSSAFLAALWGVECHPVDFLLATRPLASLARITSEDDWQRLLQETDGLVDAELLYVAVDWLQRDATQLW